MAEDKPWRDEETLRELYIKKDCGQEDIADRLGCDPSTISKWMSKFGIGTGYGDREEKTKEEIFNILQDGGGMSTVELAERIDCTRVYAWKLLDNLAESGCVEYEKDGPSGYWTLSD